MIEGARRLSDAQARQWQGGADEVPAYVHTFKVAADRMAGQNAAGGAIRGLGHAFVLLTLVGIAWFFALPYKEVFMASVGWVLFHSANTVWASRKWYKAIQAEKNLVSEYDKRIKIAPEEKKAT